MLGPRFASYPSSLPPNVDLVTAFVGGRCSPGSACNFNFAIGTFNYSADTAAPQDDFPIRKAPTLYQEILAHPSFVLRILMGEQERNELFKIGAFFFFVPLIKFGLPFSQLTCIWSSCQRRRSAVSMAWTPLCLMSGLWCNTQARWIWQPIRGFRGECKPTLWF